MRSRKSIELLFENGKPFHAWPLKLVCLPKADLTCQALFVVPKRQFKKAHDRNKLRRRIKEAYRLNKNDFYNQLKLKQVGFIVAFLYTGKNPEDFQVIQKAVIKLLSQLLKSCN